MRAVRCVAALAALLGASACSAEDTPSGQPTGGARRPAATMEETMRIRIIADGRELTATLENGAASRDFAALLPLELELKDYNGTEKIADLPAKLSRAGAPDGADPVVGDLAYYAPWGNLAIFYRDFRHSPGLIRLGRIDGDLSALTRSDRVRVRIERANPTSPDR